MRPESIDKTLDVRGMSCPLPVVKANQEISGLADGQVLEILTTDKGSLTDIPAWAGDQGHALLHQESDTGELRFYVRKGAAS